MPFKKGDDVARNAGRKGGNQLLLRRGTDWFQFIGKDGGDKLAAERGAEYYSEIGKKGAQARKLRNTQTTETPNEPTD
jgi:general stress protein YciG